MPQATPRGTYLDIAATIQQQIEARELTDELPSQAELQVLHDVSRGTIARALHYLRDQRLIESRKGAGWYVVGSGDHRPLVDRMVELLARNYEVGDVFATEMELCERLGVSRTAVRSAVAQLEGRGLVGIGPTRRREVLRLPGGQS